MRQCLWLAVACMAANSMTQAQEAAEVEISVNENYFPVNSIHNQHFLDQKTYDGTAELPQEQIDKYNNSTKRIYRPKITSGVASGDDISLTYTGFFTDDNGNKASDVMTATKAVIDIVLTGKDAAKYKIKNPKTYTCPGAINPAPVEPPAEAIDNFKLSDSETAKEYDGKSGLKLLADSILLYSSDKSYNIYIISGVFGKPEIIGGNDNTPGEGKSVTLFYRLSGNPNYALSGTNEVGVKSFLYCSSCGTIRKRKPKVTVSPTRATYGTKIDVRASIPSAEGTGWRSYIFYDDEERRTTLAKLDHILPAGRHTVTVLTDESETYMGVREDFDIMIDPLPLQMEGSPTIAPRPYDGTVRLGNVLLPTLASPAEGQVTLSFSIDSSAVRPDVGQYPVLFTPRLSDPNYTVSSQSPLTATLSITPAQVTAPTPKGSEISTTKTYDGSTDISLPKGGAPLAPDGSVFISSARFDSAAAGEWPVFVDIGADNNHVFADGSRMITDIEYPTAGVISKRKVSLNGVPTIGQRAYDGSTDISPKLISLPNLTGVVEGDDVRPFVIEAKLDNASVGKRLASIRLGLAGADAANYELDEDSLSIPVTVTPVKKRAVTIRLRNTENLVYGHSTIGSTPTADAIVDTDPIISGTTLINGLGSFVSLPVGLGQRVRVSFMPVDTARYEAVDTLLTIDVRPLGLRFSGHASVKDKAYDGSADIPDDIIDIPSLTGMLLGDSVGLAIKSASYDSKNAGEREASVLLTLIGPAAQNYVLPDNGELKFSARIAPREVSANYDELVIVPRAYDGTTTIYGWQISLPTMTGAVEGDNVVADIARDEFYYPSANVGTYYVRTHAALTGDDAANYVIHGESGSATIVREISINPKEVRPDDIAVADKEYDGTTNIATRLVTVVGGEGVRVLWAKSASPDAGTRDAQIRLALAREDDANYSLADTIVTSRVNILPRMVEAEWASMAIDQREYDGTTTISQDLIHTPLISNKIATDNLKLDIVASYDSIEAGTHLATAIVSLSGNAAGNYVLPQDTFLLQSSIMPKTLRLDGALLIADREYDGTAGVSRGLISLPDLAGVVERDLGRVSLDIVGAAADSPKAGFRTVATSIRLTGDRAGNYALDKETLTATMRILRRNLTLQGDAQVEQRIYDGTTLVDASLISLPALTGIAPTDSMSVCLKFPTAKLDKPDVGARVATISFSVVGAGIENYDLDKIPLAITAPTAVTPKKLTATPPIFSSTTKEYDGTTETPTIATEPELEGVIGSDAVTMLCEAQYDSPRVGERRIKVSYAIVGDGAGNYAAPDDCVIPGRIVEAADSIAATATVLDEWGVCGEEELRMAVSVTSGAPSRFSLIFSPGARVAGFADAIDEPLPEPEPDGQVIIGQPVTHSDTYGEFSATLTLTDAAGRCSSPVRLAFLRRPDASHLHVKFGNTLFIDNVEDRILSYQWETGGEAIDGATRQFYHTAPSLAAGQYAVRLTLADGTQVTSCPLEVSHTATEEALSVKAYPNPARAWEDVTVEVGGNADGRAVNVELYSTNGAKAATAQCRGSVTLRLPHGTYAGSATDGGRKASFKIVVE